MTKDLTLYRVYFEEKDGSDNQVLLEAYSMTRAVERVEQDDRCLRVYKAEVVY